MPDSLVTELHLKWEGGEVTIIVPAEGLVITARHEAQESENSLRRVKPYKIHVNRKGIHL